MAGKGVLFLEEQIQLIESKLQLSPIQWPPVRDYLLKAGEIKAWVLLYQGANQWTKRYYEKQWFFLFEKELLSVGVYPEGNLELSSYKLDEFARLVRSYGYTDKECTQMVLTGITILLKHTGLRSTRPEILDFKRPSASDQGDPEGFDHLVSLLV